jgi:hypothetical protein
MSCTSSEIDHSNHRCRAERRILNLLGPAEVTVRQVALTACCGWSTVIGGSLARSRTKVLKNGGAGRWLGSMYSQRPGAYAQIMTTPAPEPDLTLASVSEAADESMAAAEQTLNSELAAVGSDPPDVADMIQIQYDAANYTVAGQTVSAIMKDESETLKDVIDRIG